MKDIFCSENGENLQLEKKLKKALQSGDEAKIHEIFEKIYYQYVKLVHFSIANYLSNPQDIEELTNDVFINFFNHLETIDEKRSIKYYLIVSAKNISIDFLRKKKIDCVSFEEDNNYQENNLHHGLIYNQVIDELKKYLTEVEVKIIIEHQIYGYQLKEIALSSGASVNTIKSIYRRAIKKIRAYYQGGLL